MSVDKTCRHTEWQTPERILRPVRRYGRGIGLDPATAPNNPTGARSFYTKDDDGLALPWGGHGLVFVNPPYGRELRRWVAKIHTEAVLGAEIVALLPGQRFEQAYWQTNLFIEQLTALVAVRGRLDFTIPGRSAKGSNPFGSFLYIFNGNAALAATFFRDVGMVMFFREIVHVYPYPWGIRWEA